MGFDAAMARDLERREFLVGGDGRRVDAMTGGLEAPAGLTDAGRHADYTPSRRGPRRPQVRGHFQRMGTRPAYNGKPSHTASSTAEQELVEGRVVMYPPARSGR